MSLFASTILPVLAGITISMFAVKLAFRRLNVIGIVNMLSMELFLLLFISIGMIGFHVLAVYSIEQLTMLALIGFVFGCVGFSVIQRKKMNERKKSM